MWQCCNNPGAIIDGYVQRAIMYMQAHNEGKGGHGAMTVFLMELAIVFVNQSVLECCLSTLNGMLAHCKVIPCRRSLLPFFLPPSFFLIGRNNACSQVMIYHFRSLFIFFPLFSKRAREAQEKARKVRNATLLSSRVSVSLRCI